MIGNPKDVIRIGNNPIPRLHTQLLGVFPDRSHIKQLALNNYRLLKFKTSPLEEA